LPNQVKRLAAFAAGKRALRKSRRTRRKYRQIPDFRGFLGRGREGSSAHPGEVESLRR
jgi:hypothetical protein